MLKDEVIGSNFTWVTWRVADQEHGDLRIQEVALADRQADRERCEVGSGERVRATGS